jgi:hypothetical protein
MTVELTSESSSMPFDRKAGGHAFDLERGVCARCGMSREHFQDNDEPACSGQSEGAGSAAGLPPFVPDDQSSLNLRVHRAIGARAAIDAGLQVLPPEIRVLAGAVRYIDFGLSSARDFWEEVVLPTFDDFDQNPRPRTAIVAAAMAWHIHNWIWHENHPGTETKGSQDYKNFVDGLVAGCQELGWLRDVGDGGSIVGSAARRSKSSKPSREQTLRR